MHVEGAVRVLVNEPTGARNRIDGAADHLRAQFGKELAHPPVAKLVQADAAPDPRLVGQRGQRIARIDERSL